MLTNVDMTRFNLGLSFAEVKEQLLADAQSTTNFEASLQAVVGSKILWNLGYANTPDLLIHTNIEWNEWPDQHWHFMHDIDKMSPCDYYISSSEDGRFLVHYHERFVGQEAVKGDENNKIWVTRKSEGYGGRRFPITMADGSKAELIGPWHGGSPPGLNLRSISYAPASESTKPYPMYYFGVYISDQLYRAICAKLHPDIPLVEDQYGLWFDKTHAPQEAIETYLKAQDTEQSRQYALDYLKRTGIPY